MALHALLILALLLGSEGHRPPPAVDDEPPPAPATAMAPQPPSVPAAASDPPRLTLCYENLAWRRPSVEEQSARLAAHPPYRHLHVDDDSPDARTFRQAAFFYDLRQNSATGGLLATSGLWSDKGLRSAACPFERLALIGFSPTRYAAEARGRGELTVVPKEGLRVFAFSGPRPERIVVSVDGRTLVELRISRS